jgi:hypothetical protein
MRAKIVLCLGRSSDRGAKRDIVKLAGIVQDSSDFALSRQQLKLLGIVFALLGLMEFVFAFFIASSITTHQAAAETQAVVQANECKTRLSALGYKATLNGNKLTAELSGLDDAAYKLGQASIALLSCQGWSETKFCMGEGCGGSTGGIQFELQPTKTLASSFTH